MNSVDGFDRTVGALMRDSVAQVPPHPPRAAAVAAARRRQTTVRATACAAVVVVAGAGAAVALDGGGTPPTRIVAQPSTPAVRTAVGVPFDLYTHCGVRFLTFRGVTYRAEHPLGAEGAAPSGWDDPYQKGVLTVLGADRVRFTAEGVPSVDFVATAERPPLCN